MPPFRHLLRARYAECDAQGIVFNARFGEWTDLATTELLRALDPRTLAPGGTETVDYRLRHQQTEWLAPAHFDDVVEATPVVEAVGTTSFTVTTTFRRLSTRDALANVRTVYVLVDTAGGKRPVSDALRARLLAGAPDRVADHADVGAGGRVVRVVRAADRITMPWKNGGGVTHELVREREGAAGFGVRLSIAEVAADGPFSRFPGVDRVIVLLRGGGFRLLRDDGLVVAIPRPNEPFAFLGEDAWDCTLPEGPVVDFNVMTDRATCRACVAVRGPGRVEGRWALALADGRIGGVDVATWDLVELDGAVFAEVPSVVTDVQSSRETARITARV